MLKVAVIGVGHLGRHHARILSEMDNVELVAVVDPDQQQGQAIAESCGTQWLADLNGIPLQLDMAVIAVPTVLHEKCAIPLLEAKVACLIEKPMAPDPETCQRIIDCAEANQTFVAVGHVERFNPAVKRAIELVIEARFIEAHRLAPYSFRSTDVGVVLDLMIHDIDIILSVVKSPIKNIEASGVAVISETPDISNARIEFENGCVANLTASRISLKKMRKSRFFQKNAYISVDFLDKKVEVVKIKNAPKESDDFSLLLSNAEGKKKQIYFENPKIIERNAIQDELEHFAEAIKMKKNPNISLKDGAKALEVAHKIISCIG